jgi:hypothetical protein
LELENLIMDQLQYHSGRFGLSYGEAGFPLVFFANGGFIFPSKHIQMLIIMQLYRDRWGAVGPNYGFILQKSNIP